MRVLSGGLLGSSLIALALLSACSEKKSFSGGTPAGAVAKTEDAEPETVPADEPAPVTKPTVKPQVDFQDCDTQDANVFVADLFELSPSTKQLPDFGTLSVIKQICLKQIDITDREFTDGFPGVETLKEWFGLNFNFNLKVAKAGLYKFKTISDDGSILLIDGKVVLDNDGKHSATSKENSIELAAGTHKMNLKYFQGPANRIALELLWAPPGEAESYIPTKLITRQ